MAVEYVNKVRVDDTLEMGYFLDDFTDPWKTPQTIVMLHGCRKPRQVFYAWIPTLAREFRVIRPHLRGHWDSTPAPAGYQWTVEGLVRDLKNFLDAMQLDRVHVIGESLGGLLGYHLAYHHPERIKSLTLATCPGPGFKQHAAKMPLGKLMTMENPPEWRVEEKTKVELVGEFGLENQAHAAWHSSECGKCPEEATKAYFRAAAECAVNAEEFLARIDVPTLSMTGAEHTRIVTVQEAQRLCDLMPRAKLVTFPDMKAQCQFVIPERCAEEALRFIMEQEASSVRVG